MQYMLLIYSSEAEWDALTETERQAIYARYTAVEQEMMQAGVIRGGAELAPSRTASSIRVRHGKPQRTDGPFTETKEMLGGYFLIDVPGLEQAEYWAARLPTAENGTIEVRALTANQI